MNKRPEWMPAVGDGEESVRCATYGCGNRVVIKTNREEAANPNHVYYCAKCTKPRRRQMSEEEADLAEEFRILDQCERENKDQLRISRPSALSPYGRGRG